MAQRAYFETVFHNIKLVGSLAAAQGGGYGDAYFRYKADWDKRRSLYDSVGKAKLGDGTRNVKYSKEFLDTFSMLDFSTGDGVAAFDSAFNNLDANGDLNSFEKSALEAGRSAANRALNSKAKKDNYDKRTKGDPRAKAKQKSQVDYLNKIAAPLNSNSLSVGGQDLGNTGDQYKAGGGLTANAISKELSDSEKTGNSESKSNIAAFDPSKYQNNTSYGAGSGVSGYGQDYSAYDSNDEVYSDKKGSIGANQKASGMSQEEIERMLSASQGDKDLNSTDGDNIFTAVSKAYKRNYDVFFSRKSNQRQKIKSDVAKPLDSDEKSKLKKLLGN